MASMHSRGRGRRTINEINMVPFIDVMLVLLIIFMVTAPMITPSMVDLPSMGKAAKQPDKVVQVVIQKDDSIELVSEGISHKQSLSSLAGAVKASIANTSEPGQVINAAVVISADRSVKYESVVKVMDTLQRAGVQRVGLSVQLAP
jgi:biopolymer transport protein TolR